MKLRWTLGLLLTGALAVSALAQPGHSQIPGIGGTPPEPPNDSAVTPNSTLQPRDALNAYEEQMALITAQAYEELGQIAQAVRTGQITSDEAQHLSRRCFELTIVRLQFLDTLHQIAETTISKEDPGAKPGDQSSEVRTSEQTLVVAPPISSPNISESIVKYLELTPAQVAAIQTRITKVQKQAQPLLQRLSENRKALAAAIHARPFRYSLVQRLAVEQSHILQQLILANSRAERDLYGILNFEQRQKLQAVETETPDITQQSFAQR